MKRLLTSLFVAFLASTAHGAVEIPNKDEYAYRFGLNIQHSAEYVAAEIPLEVYRSVSDANLRDIGVYNGADQAVPRMVERRNDEIAPTEQTRPLGYVPLYGELSKNQDRLRLLMQRSDSGTTLELDSQPTEEESPAAELKAHIVDLREIDTGFAALDFHWAETTHSFVGTLIVEESDDLAQWRTLARGSIADLEFDGTRIEQRRIELPRKSRDFLRISWRGMPDAWQITAINGIQRQRGPDHDREWIDLYPAEVSEDGRTFNFNIEGYPPADRLNLVFTQSNVVARASIQSRAAENAHWRQAHQGLFYSVVRGGTEVSSPPARIGATRANEWQVVIHSGSPGEGVKLRIGWRPDRLLFLTQGNAPYELATGRARDRLEGFPQEKVLGDRGIFELLKDAGKPGRADILPRQAAAGAMVMEYAGTWTWRTVLVWIGLICAVLFVGWLAWSVLRENNTHA